MATRARGRLKCLLTGSVAETLVDKAGAPVLLVRGTKAKADLDSSVSLRRALVPLDGSPEAERILKPLVALRQLEETEQTLLRVLPYPRYSPELRTCFSVCEFAAEQHDRALSSLEDSANGLRPHLPRVKTDVVFSDNAPAKEILLQAQSRKADLIAVATRRRSGRMKRLFGGSVTDTLIRKANVPLLITSQPSD
jgi:nucleotide-binding universal stress UspA family protein